MRDKSPIGNEDSHFGDNEPGPSNIVDGLFGGGLLCGVLEFLPPTDLAAAAMAYPPSKDLVRSLHHDEERHYIIQASRIHKCIKILQDTDIATDGNYDKITVPDGGIPLGEWVLIMNDDRDNWHDEEAHLDGYSGVAVKCVQNGGIIVVYALLAFFFDYGPLVLVKGTTESIFPYDRGNKILEDAGHPEFHYPRVSWWEMPPRNRAEMREISLLDPSLNAEYWDRLEARRAAIIRRNEDCYNIKDVDVETYTNLRIINIITQEEYERGWFPDEYNH
jgi:hypothetical protein